jgi:hypothetical protein
MLGSASYIGQLLLELQVERYERLYFTVGYTIEVIKYMLGDIRIFIYSRQVLEEVSRVIGAIRAAVLVEGGRY